MKIYLAARLSRAEEMRGYAVALEGLGIEVTSRWIHGGHEWVNVPDETMPAYVGERFATEDLDDLDDAEIVICFTEASDVKPSRGGRHVEAGYALAKGKQLVVVGPLENVFYCLAAPQLSGFDGLLSWLRHQLRGRS